VDWLFFQSKNASTIAAALVTSYSQNPVGSWGVTFLIVSLVAFVAVVLFRHRREFLNRLKAQLAAAERITFVDLASKTDVTPARIEAELTRMARSRIRRLPGLVIVSQGKHVYLGEKLLNQIIELYQQKRTSGEIAGSLQIVRDELDKAITHLVEKRLIERREELTTQKIRPSYRRGTR
jgi:DNA-binding MarR family transcriptional regulator